MTQRVPEIPEDMDKKQPARETCHTLVVDDNAVDLHVLKEYFSLYGRVTTATSGEDAIRRLRHSAVSDPVDVIVVDIQLPRMTGHEVLQRITALKAEHTGVFSPHVLMSSSLDTKEDVLRALSMGASGYLVKPIQMERVEAQMSTIGFSRVVETA